MFLQSDFFFRLSSLSNNFKAYGQKFERLVKELMKSLSDPVESVEQSC